MHLELLVERSEVRPKTELILFFPQQVSVIGQWGTKKHKLNPSPSAPLATHLVYLLDSQLHICPFLTWTRIISSLCKKE